MDFICEKEDCTYYLNLECVECRKTELDGEHKHQCASVESYVKKLYEKIIKSLTDPIKEVLKEF